MYIMCAIGRHFEIVIQSACNISMIGNIDLVVSEWPRNIRKHVVIFIHQVPTEWHIRCRVRTKLKTIKNQILKRNRERSYWWIPWKTFSIIDKNNSKLSRQSALKKPDIFLTFSRTNKFPDFSKTTIFLHDFSMFSKPCCPIRNCGKCIWSITNSHSAWYRTSHWYLI